jgi:hypothetical protein
VNRIIYISTARRRPTEAEIQDILEVSRRNNRRDGLSGLLIVAGQRFLQVLEGDREPLEQAYERIKVDARHFALVQLEWAQVEGRSFPEWQMGHVGAAEASGDTLGGLVTTLTECVTDQNLRAHLRGFADLYSRAA